MSTSSGPGENSAACPRCGTPYATIEALTQPALCRRCWTAEAAERRALPTASDTVNLGPEPATIAIDRPGVRWITKHFSVLADRPPAAFTVRLWLEMQIVVWSSALAITLLGLPPRKTLDGLGDLALIFGAGVVAPLLETLVFQVFFCAIARKLGCRFWTQAGIVWLPFFLAHFAEGVSTALCAGGMGGFFFAFAYVSQRRFSLGRAFAVTAALHALNNGVALALLLLERHHLI